jgi:hypothetical protein
MARCQGLISCDLNPVKAEVSEIQICPRLVEAVQKVKRRLAKNPSFAQGERSYLCSFLPFQPRGARGSLQGQLGFPSWDRPLADSYQPTFDASTTTLVLIPTRS